jgi:hypothetical protein
LTYGHNARLTSSAFAFTIVIFVGFFIRFHGITDLPFIEDAFYTIRDSTLESNTGNSRPVYFLLQKAVFQFLPVSHLSVRILPLGFGLFGILALWVAGHRIFGPQAGLLSAALVALSPWHIYMSQIGRYWSLVFLEAAVFVWLIGEIRRGGGARCYIAALFVAVVGIFTHPSFVFLVAGILASVFITSTDGNLRFKVPKSKVIWALGLSLGLVIAIASTVVWQKILSASSLSGADLRTTLRVAPAAVQWLGPVVFMASAFAMLSFFSRSIGRMCRWWGPSAILVLLAFAGGMLIVGQIREIYVYYLTAFLPIVYLSIGGAIQTFQDSKKIEPMTGTLIAAMLIVSVSPSVVSNFKDGTRFDYRPAYAHIMRSDHESPVFGTPASAARFYAPDLDFHELSMRSDQLRDALSSEHAIWVIASYRRYGFLNDENSQIERWLWANCRVTQRHEPPRFDYRRYATLLYHCSSIP